MSGAVDNNLGAVRILEWISGVHDEALRVCYVLDGEWNLQVLKDSSTILIDGLGKHLIVSPVDFVAEDAIPILREYLFSLMKEETVKYTVLPEIYRDVMHWLAIDVWNCVTRSRVVGKAEIRARLLSYLAEIDSVKSVDTYAGTRTTAVKRSILPAVSALQGPGPSTFDACETIPVGVSSIPVVSEPIPSLGPTPFVASETTPVGMPSPFVACEKMTPFGVPSSTLFQPPACTNFDYEAHKAAMRHSDSLLNTVGKIEKFTGVSDNYIIWRYNLFEVLSTYHCWYNWTGYYLTLGCLSGISIEYARRVPLKVAPIETIKALFESMDKRFLTTHAMSAFEVQFEDTKQLTTESCDSYALRFMRLANIREKVVGATSDLQLRLKFSRGLLSQFDWVRSLCDSLNLPLDDYITTLVTYTRGFGGSTPGPVPAHGMPHLGAIGTSRPLSKQDCFRCNGKNHFASQCSGVLTLAGKCGTCGSLRHVTSACDRDQKSLRCNRCHKEVHLSSVCRSPQPLGVRGQQNVTSDLTIQNKSIAICCQSVDVRSRCGGIAPNELFLPAVEVDFQIGDDSRFVNISCLVDSGASSSFIHTDVYEFLLTNSLILESREVNLDVSFANGEECHTAQAVLVDGFLLGVHHSVWFPERVWNSHVRGKAQCQTK